MTYIRSDGGKQRIYMQALKANAPSYKSTVLKRVCLRAICPCRVEERARAEGGRRVLADEGCRGRRLRGITSRSTSEGRARALVVYGAAGLKLNVERSEEMKFLTEG